MRNLLALFGLVVIGFAGTGWYMGWYKLTVSRGLDGNLEIRTDVDTKKVSTDTSDALKNVSSTIGNKVEKTAEEVQVKIPAGTPGDTPGPVTLPQASSLIPPAPPIPDAPPAPTHGRDRIHLVAPK